jgi:hypothetical protein
MTAEDFAQLRARADAGDREAMTALGKRLLRGAGGAPHVPAGARYISEAAAKESGEALAQLAVLVAAGIANQPNWDTALDHLQRSAALGWVPAQDELRFLAHRDGGDFVKLRKAVDIEAWLKPPETTLVSERPRILTARALMSKAECERIIAKVQGRLRRAGVYDPDTGGESVVDHRSNTKAELFLTDIDLPFMLLHARMSAMLGLPSACFELTNVLHYFPGEQFKPHFDYLEHNEPGHAANMQALGQRIVTLLVYLNDGYEGGETRFPRINYAYKGRTGDALMFGNVNDKGAPDPLTLHEGVPPRSGEKWLLSQWVRDRPPLMATNPA